MSKKNKSGIIYTNSEWNLLIIGFMISVFKLRVFNPLTTCLLYTNLELFCIYIVKIPLLF